MGQGQLVQTLLYTDLNNPSAYRPRSPSPAARPSRHQEPAQFSPQFRVSTVVQVL